MKRALIGLGVCGLAVVAWAMQSQITFADKANNMVLRDFDSWNINLTREGLTFSGSGDPLTGTWKQQGMTIVGQRMNGAAVRGAAGAYTLQSATVSGNARATFAKEGSPSTRVDTESLRFNSGQQGNRIEAPNALTITSNNPTAGSSMVVKGASGSVLTPVGGNKPFLSAEVAGPVTFTSTETAVENGQRQTYKINGRADRANVDNTGANPIVTMTGNVQIAGNHPTLAADLTGVQKAVVTLDQNFEAQSVSISGSPARTTVKDTGAAAQRQAPVRGKR